MKNKIGLLFVCSTLWLSSVFAADECFILSDLKSHKLLKQEGNICDARLTPASTFKIALSLMGCDAKVLKDAKNPEWQYRPEYKAALPLWRAAHNPTSWIKDSCVWYSKVLTQKLGMKKFKHYVEILNYGNKDLFGNPAWLSSSLKISNKEQVLFLEKMLDKKFPLSDHAYEMTKQILFVEKLNNGWDLYGKIGKGYKQNADSSLSDEQIAWFVGWATKNDHTIVFVKTNTGRNIQGSELKESIRQFILKDNVFAN